MVTRRKGERIRLRVGGVVAWVEVVRVDAAGQVRIEIDAPRDQVEVLREEIVEERACTPPPE